MSLDALLNRKPASLWEQFYSAPSLFIARRALYAFQSNSTPRSNTIRVICISDTHNQHESISYIPNGDILIHAGDLTQSGTPGEMHAVLKWMSSQPHTHKLFVAGNHDGCMANDVERKVIEAAYPGLVYLRNSSVSISIRGRSLELFGSPWTPKNGSWPFQYLRNASSDVWSTIPLTTDVLVTHGPPAHHLDLSGGCKALLGAIWRVRPLLHVFGHMHAGRGTTSLSWTDGQAAYETIASDQGGWTNLFTIIRDLFFRTWWLCTGLRRAERRTILVNAAIIGGFRNERVNCPIVVDI